MKQVDKSIFKQLIPGNPGTSFVVALMYVLDKRYGVKLSNEGQLKLFTDGIVNSRKVFFSGVLEEIAKRFNKSIEATIGDQFVYQWAKEEITSGLIAVKHDYLNAVKVGMLLEKYGATVLSVDVSLFLPYHDYHFVTLEKIGNQYQIFEPKSGNIYDLPASNLEKLINSISEGLNDIPMAFCI